MWSEVCEWIEWEELGSKRRIWTAHDTQCEEGNEKGAIRATRVASREKSGEVAKSREKRGGWKKERRRAYSMSL